MAWHAHAQLSIDCILHLPHSNVHGVCTTRQTKFFLTFIVACCSLILDEKLSIGSGVQTFFTKKSEVEVETFCKLITH
jgi:hypothetical protein